MNNPLLIQGDVCLRKCELPTGAQEVPKSPIALGETSGHAHEVVDVGLKDDWGLFVLNGKRFVVTGHDGAQLRHQKTNLPGKPQADHFPLNLEANSCYEVFLQEEFNPESAAFERVLD